MNIARSHDKRQRLSGLDRRSCTWRDAAGSGFVIGPTERLLDLVARQARAGYCDNRL